MSARRVRRNRHRLHGNPFNVRGQIDGLDVEAVYGRKAPIALDIGFGGGSFTLALARLKPQWNVLGLEIRQHLVDDLLANAYRRGVANVHAVLANASLHLRALIPDRSVVFVALNFPDPWYKKRHHKRRVVQREWLEVLAVKLLPAADIHFASDYRPIAAEILDLLEGVSGMVNLAGRGRFAAANPMPIASERERTHTQRGEPIYRLQFRFSPVPGDRTPG